MHHFHLVLLNLLLRLHPQVGGLLGQLFGDLALLHHLDTGLRARSETLDSPGESVTES